MSLRLGFRPGDLGALGRNVYRHQDLVLEYVGGKDTKHRTPTLGETIDEGLGINRPQFYLLIADTLSLVFSGPDLCFVSYDIYANRELWRKSVDRRLPDVRARGALTILEHSADTDRLSLDSIPSLEIDTAGEWIRIVMTDSVATDYFEIAKDVLVGLVGGRITDMFLLSPEFL